MYVIPHNEVGTRLEESIIDLYIDCFGWWCSQVGRSRIWHSAPSWLVISEAAGEVQGHIAFIDRQISVGSHSVRVAGLQGVAVRSDLQSRGMCRAMVGLAMTEAKRLGYDYGFLFCRHDLERLYVRLGFTPVASRAQRKLGDLGRRLGFDATPCGRRVVRVDETGAELDASMPIAMWYGLNATTFPQGSIHLRGNNW